MPVNPVDEDILVRQRVQSDFEELLDWGDRVLRPLARRELTYPNREHFNPFEAMDPNTRDRYYTPEDQKRRVLNPIDKQDIAYIPEGKENDFPRQTLGDWVDETEKQREEEKQVPDWNQPLPIEIDDESDPVGNLDTTPDSSRVKEFSRPIVKQGMSRLGGPTGTYDELPEDVKRQIESQYPGKGERGSSRSITGQHSLEDAMAGKAKARFFPEELEELGLDPEDTTWWNNPGHPAWEFFLKAPPAPMPMYKYEELAPGPAMNLGGPTSEDDNPYLPAGFGDEAPTNDTFFDGLEKPQTAQAEYDPAKVPSEAFQRTQKGAEAVLGAFKSARDSVTEAMDLYNKVAEQHGHAQAMTGPARAIYKMGHEFLTTLYSSMEQLGTEGYTPGQADTGAVGNAFNAAGAFASGGFARGALQKAGTSELGMFGGRLAGRKQGLDLAEQALKAGDDPEIVKQATGWWRGPDGEMRFLINPKQMAFQPEPKVYRVGDSFVSPLAEVVSHPTLFKEYPELAQAFVVYDSRLGPGEASYNFIAGKHWIRMNQNMQSDPKWMSTLVHEVQHGLQEIENFARGADFKVIEKDVLKNLDKYLKGGPMPDEVRQHAVTRFGFEPDENQLRDSLLALKKKDLKEYGKTRKEFAQAIGYNQYYKSQGEVESRLAQSLLHMSEGEIRMMDFATAGDVPVNQRTFNFDPTKFGAGKPLSIGKGPFTDNDVKEIVDIMTFNRKLDQEYVNKNLDAKVKKQMIKEANDNNMTDEQLEGIVTRELDKVMKPANDDFKEVETISTGLVSKLRSVQEGLSPSKKMGPIEAEIAKLETRVREMEGKGRKVVAEDVANWLEMAGVEGVRVVEASTGTKYIKFPDPTVLGDVGQVRVPSDGHRSRRIPSGMLETGEEFTKKPSPSDLRNVEPKSMNAEGGRYSEWENLVDALKWRLSKSPDGQWLISPGKEPKAKALKQENTGDTISKDPDQLEFDFGKSEMMNQQSQQQQARGNPKHTASGFDEQLVEMHRSGMSYDKIGEVINADRKAKLLDPMSSKTIERKIKEFKKLREEMRKRLKLET